MVDYPITPNQEGKNVSSDGVENVNSTEEEVSRSIESDKSTEIQESALVSYALCSALRLSEETSTKFRIALVNALNEKSHDFRTRINKSIGTTALDLLTNLDPDNPLIKSLPEALRLKDNGSQNGSDQSEIDLSHYNHTEKIKLAPGVKLFDHESAPEPMLRALSEIYPNNSNMIQNMSPNAVSLVFYQTIEAYRDPNFIIGVDPQKRDLHIKAMAAYCGLYEPVLSVERIHHSHNLSNNALGSAMEKLKSNLYSLVSDQFYIYYQTALNTLYPELKNEIFTTDPTYGANFHPEVINENDRNGEKDTGPVAVALKEPKPADNNPEIQIVESLKGVKLKSYDKTPQPMTKTLIDIFSKDGLKIRRLTSQEAALVLYQVLLVHLNKDLMRDDDIEKRAIKVKKLCDISGLYSDPVSFQELAEREGHSETGIHHTVRKLKTRLRYLLEDQFDMFVEKAKKAIHETNDSDIFLPPSVQSPKEVPKKTVKHKEKRVPQPQKQVVEEPKTSSPEIVSENEVEDKPNETRQFYNHGAVPLGMRNFIFGVFPANEGKKIEVLDHSSCSLLVSQLLECWIALAKMKNSPQVSQDNHLRVAEEFTGLYGGALTTKEIGKKHHKKPESVRPMLDRMTQSIADGVPKAVLKKLLNDAALATLQRKQQDQANSPLLKQS